MNFLRFSDLVDSGQLSGKRVFIRADLNVPLKRTEGGDIHIVDDTRILASIPAIEKSIAAGAAVMVTSHLGRPKEGALSSEDSLAPIAKRMEELLNRPVRLCVDWVNNPPLVQLGEVVLLENCRGNIGEKANHEGLSQQMAQMVDVYVNDAFGTAHRAEATTHGMIRFCPVACAGPLMTAELDALTAALSSPQKPLVAIVAGSKVSTKLTILQALSEQVDLLFVGGGICNTFMAASGLSVGKSLYEPDLLNEAKAVIEKMAKRGAQVPIPVDVVVGKKFASNEPAVVKLASEVLEDDMIFDIGPQTAKNWGSDLMKAGTIVWNGPVGVFEFDQFGEGTKVIAESIADSTGFSIAGGGDTIAAINKFGVYDKINYISTAGGAFLEFLEGKTLPAVSALIEHANSRP